MLPVVLFLKTIQSSIPIERQQIKGYNLVNLCIIFTYYEYSENVGSEITLTSRTKKAMRNVDPL
jgi:hypothetical protein